MYITVRNLCKRFGRTEVLRGLNLEVEQGEIVALMGANGAGKTTLFRILSTLDPRFEGDVSIGGYDIRKAPEPVREMMGYVPSRAPLYDDLSVAENLAFFAGAYGCQPDAITALSPHIWPGLAPFAGRRAGTLSGGMRQKLAFCCSVVHNPRVLLLDELTTGIDPEARKEVWLELKDFQRRGGTILISTHYLDDAESADRVLTLTTP